VACKHVVKVRAAILAAALAGESPAGGNCSTTDKVTWEDAVLPLARIVKNLKRIKKAWVPVS
jgi:hypothetical protein